MIIQGDCIRGMKTLPDGCVQTCITSPPYYGLRDYGTAIYEGGNIDCEHSISGWSDSLKPDCDRPERDGTKRQFCLKCGAKRIDDQIGLEETPEKYVEKMVAVFREVKRILRDDGTVWLNLGDSYCGSGGAGNQFGQLDSGLNKYKQAGTPKEIGLKPKDLIGIPWRVAFGLQADGWYLRQDIIWHKPNPMPESVTDRCTKSHEYIFLLSKNKNYYFDHEAIKEEATTVPTVRNKAAEGYQADYAKGDRFSEGERIYGADGKRNKRSVWTVNLKPYGGAHFATYPPELIAPCVLASTSERGCCSKCGVCLIRKTEIVRSFESGSGKSENLPIGKNGKNLQGGGKTKDVRNGIVCCSKTLGWELSCKCKDPEVVPCTVFDPFTGSGTTGAVALKWGRKFIGCELNPEYVKLAETRIGNEFNLFMEAETK